MEGTGFWEFLGWLALSLNIWGNIALTSKGVRGWVIRLACNACWIPYAIHTQAWPLLANHVLFAGINIYGWHKWTKDLNRALDMIKKPEGLQENRDH